MVHLKRRSDQSDQQDRASQPNTFCLRDRKSFYLILIIIIIIIIIIGRNLGRAWYLISISLFTNRSLKMIFSFLVHHQRFLV